jgi:hypothetical protein
MASKTEIANLALSHLGVGKEISNLDTDNSSEGSVCRRFFESARDIVFSDFNWPFATKIRSLSLIEEDPNEDWQYSYRYPTDCLRAIRILSGTRNDTNDSRERYKISRDASGGVIYSDKEDAQLEYIERVTDVDRYPVNFTMALSFRLAHYIAPTVTGGDPYKLGDRAMQLYMAEMSRASANLSNEEQPDKYPDSEFERSRN